MERALRKHFSSCGEITDVCVPIDWGSMRNIPIDVEFDPKTNILERSAYIYFLGEGAVAGWNISVEAFPFPQNANEYTSIMAHMQGTGIADKVLELDGSYMGGRKLSVRLVDIPGIYTVHKRPHRYRGPLV
ncbi:hypothetical protein CARUB_v10015525mg [Capsella rubella]|uniref:Uncharacterized protein n=1 Tax=Capsella rubella TaxID=81985 RepID=R0I2V8_9BRAS|nr:hypothetical protein CARUB_v10015525mg [Capsella rubella]